MRCSFFVTFEAFSLQLYYQPNFSSGIVLVFLVLQSKKHLFEETTFGGCFHFILSAKRVNRRKNL